MQLKANTFHLKVNKGGGVWVNSRSCWWTGRPGVLLFMGSKRVGHDWASDQIWLGAKGTLLGTGDLRQVHCVQESVKHRAFLSVSLLNLLFSFFFSVHTAEVVKILPSPGIKPGLSAPKEKSPNHWTTREFLRTFLANCLGLRWCPFCNALFTYLFS